jgi:hypothetical protein
MHDRAVAHHLHFYENVKEAWGMFAEEASVFKPVSNVGLVEVMGEGALVGIRGLAGPSNRKKMLEPSLSACFRCR